MKKLFSICISVLILSSIIYSPISAQENTTSTDEDTTTFTNEETDTTTNDISTTDADPTDETSDSTDITEDTDTTDTSTTTTSQESTGFLDNINTMWLWVILGVGGVVLVGSLIGIISISKKEEMTTDVQTASQSNEKQESVTETPVEQPVQVPIPPTEEIKPEEVPTTPEIPSIKETLGDTSVYKQPETNTQVVSNVAPQANVDKDLADLNMIGQQQTVQPQVSTIETATVKPENITPVVPIDNQNAIDANQEQLTPNIQEPLVNNNGINLTNNVPTNQEPVVPAPMENIFVKPTEVPQNPIHKPTPGEPIATTPPVNNSMPTPQNQEQILTNENLPNEGLNQPIDTTSL